MGSESDRRADSVDPKPEETPLKGSENSQNTTMNRAKSQAQANIEKAKQKGASLKQNFASFVNKKSKDVKDDDDRDVNGIHDDLKVQFSDVIAEPDGTISMAQIWNGSARGYRFGRKICYNLLSMILGIPLAIFWGAYFALLAFVNIWCCVPCVKSLTIQFKFISTVWGLFVNTLLDPLFISFGRMFSAIKISIRNDKQDSVV